MENLSSVKCHVKNYFKIPVWKLFIHKILRKSNKILTGILNKETYVTEFTMMMTLMDSQLTVLTSPSHHVPANTAPHT